MSIEGGIWKILSKHASIDEVFDLNELKPVVGVWCLEWYNDIKVSSSELGTWDIW